MSYGCGMKLGVLACVIMLITGCDGLRKYQQREAAEQCVNGFLAGRKRVNRREGLVIAKSCQLQIRAWAFHSTKAAYGPRFDLKNAAMMQEYIDRRKMIHSVLLGSASDAYARPSSLID